MHGNTKERCVDGSKRKTEVHTEVGGKKERKK
jgi:hypothetical protein